MVETWVAGVGVMINLLNVCRNLSAVEDGTRQTLTATIPSDFNQEDKNHLRNDRIHGKRLHFAAEACGYDKASEVWNGQTTFERWMNCLH